MTTVNRTIFFYRVDSGLKPSGESIQYDPIPTLQHIDSLKFDYDGRYLTDINGRIICCWPDSIKMPCKCRLGSIRRDDLPGVESQGEITALEIPEESGLVEQTHIVFFENGIAACDFNYFAPRISKFANYVAQKAVGFAPPLINFSPILRKDISRQLKKYKDIRLWQLRIHAPFLSVIKDINENLGEAFEGAIKAGNADDVELVLRPSKRSRGWLRDELLEDTKKLIRHPDISYESTKFMISGFDCEQEKVVALDLLSDKLMVKKPIARMEVRSRNLSSKAAYAAIISAYNEFRDELSESPSISVVRENFSV